MILLDPDLDSDLSPKRSKGSANGANSRKERIPSRQTLARFLREAQAAVRLRGQVTVLLTTDSEIRRLNRRFRGKNKATDVLSFPAHPSPVPKSEGPGAPERILGDLAISVATARRQAIAQGHELAAEIKVLMLHGLLHLAGYDHETDDGEMARREQKLRAGLRLPQGLIERTERHPQRRPSGAKARRHLARLGGTTEVVPFQNTSSAARRGLVRLAGATEVVPFQNTSSAARRGLARLGGATEVVPFQNTSSAPRRGLARLGGTTEVVPFQNTSSAARRGLARLAGATEVVPFQNASSAARRGLARLGGTTEVVPFQNTSSVRSQRTSVRGAKGERE